MNTPYPELAIDGGMLGLFAEWNAGIQASMDEYHTHPTARCPHGGNCTRAHRRRVAAQ